MNGLRNVDEYGAMRERVAELETKLKETTKERDDVAREVVLLRAERDKILRTYERSKRSTSFFDGRSSLRKPSGWTSHSSSSSSPR